MIGMADTHSNNMDGVMSMGIMNALRTGNPQIDMILALLLPFALNFLITSFKKLYEWIHQKGLFFGYYKAHPKYESRVITHTVVRDEYGDVINVDSEFDTHNSALIKAVRLYLYNVKKLRLKDADIDLMKNEDKSSSSDGHEEKYDEYGNLSRGNTLADHMSQYDVVPSVPKDKYISIGQYGTSMTTIELMIGQNQEEDNGNEDDDNDERSHRRRNRTKETMVKYQFRAKNGSAIDDFLAKAFEYYLGVLRAQEDHSRYLFELKVSNDENSTNHTFKRYRLSEEKTFESLFFSEKDSLLTLIDNFRNRSGRYSIAGYPHKLGLLLHGPPGTGKTSLIKSIAQYTGRSIINVPLSRISTNTELMSLFYSCQRKVEGQYAPTQQGFQDVIFVMEDVDAASKVVKRRDGMKASGSTFKDAGFGFQTQPTVEGKSIFQMFVESKNDKAVELISKLVDKSDRLKEELQKADTFKSITKKLTGLTGLGYVNEAICNPQLKQLAKEALADAKKQAEETAEVNSLLQEHAETLLNLVEKVDKIDDGLVDELLNKSSMVLPSASAPQQVDDDDDSLDSLYLGMGAFGEEKKEDKGPTLKGKFPFGKKSQAGPKNFAGFSSFLKPPPDALNLQGLLNVLDGVVDSPGRIIIMTTNHPEQLDPALIRPGRVDKKLFLGSMAAKDIIAMIEHYYQTTLDSIQRRQIEDMLVEKMSCPGLQIVPAQLEQMTAEFDSADELIETLAFQFKANSNIRL